MTVEIGHYALVLALALSLVQAVAPFLGARRGDVRLMEVGTVAAVGVLALVALSFAALTVAYLGSDFSVANVYANSHSQKPTLFKLTGVWGNHEGSLLLWVLILALCSAAVALLAPAGTPRRLLADTLAVQGAITVLFLAFVLKASNPFLRLDPAPPEGRDLNPLLQDIGLAIHPPLLYVGYVGFSVAFSFAVAALVSGRVDAIWARAVRPWTLLAWSFLTLGIAMGSYWAYYELGWGGYWFWDPVENASLMPWLAGTALLHSVLVMEKREALKVWTILLALVTFALSLLGTFLVRSGVLTSVHAFAVDPERGLIILAMLGLIVGASLTLYAWRAPTLTQGGLFAPVSREGALVFNNLVLVATTAAVLIGTLYPLGLEMVTGAKISVGPPFFNLTAVPIFALGLLALPFGQTLAWKRGDVRGASQRLLLAAASGLAVVAIGVFVSGGRAVLAPLALGLGAWVALGSAVDLAERVFRGGMGVAWARARGVPRAAYGATLSHLGMGVLVIGVAMTAFERETITTLAPGETASVAGFEIGLTELAPEVGPNFTQTAARFEVREGGVLVGRMEGAKRLYPARSMPTTEAAILTRGLSQVYVTPAEIRPDGRLDLRAAWKPLVLLIWIGALVSALGAMLALSDMRLRIAAPKLARGRRAPSAVPAE